MQKKNIYNYLVLIMIVAIIHLPRIHVRSKKQYVC